MCGRKCSRPFRSSAVFLRDRLRQPILTLLLAGPLVFGPAATVLADVTCKPVLSFRNVREIRPPILQIAPWTWTASIVADTRFCATGSGSFEIDFIRTKENSAELQFTEKLRWRAGQFEVSIELTADKAIQESRIGFVAPCVCRDFPQIDSPSAD